jgi:hypothetical protein
VSRDIFILIKISTYLSNTIGNKSPVGGSPLSKTIYYAPKDKNTIYIIVHDSLCISTDKDSSSKNPRGTFCLHSKKSIDIKINK